MMDKQDKHVRLLIGKGKGKKTQKLSMCMVYVLVCVCVVGVVEKASTTVGHVLLIIHENEPSENYTGCTLHQVALVRMPGPMHVIVAGCSFFPTAIYVCSFPDAFIPHHVTGAL